MDDDFDPSGYDDVEGLSEELSGRGIDSIQSPCRPPMTFVASRTKWAA